MLLPSPMAVSVYPFRLLSPRSIFSRCKFNFYQAEAGCLSNDCDFMIFKKVEQFDFLPSKTDANSIEQTISDITQTLMNSSMLREPITM